MESLYDLLDIEEFMARKAATHKRHGSGLEAPRNSLELQMEKYYGLYAAQDNILYAHHISKEPDTKECFSNEAPIRRLISKDISKRSNSIQNSPSVVARLMGVDTLPFYSKSAQKLVYAETGNNLAGKLIDKQRSRKGSVGQVLSTSDRFMQPDVSLFHHYDDKHHPDQCSSHVKSSKPKRREHPQEEELQKFKKEFEAWQAARFNECSKVAKFVNDPAQLIAQDHLNKQKMSLYANSKRITTTKGLSEHSDLSDIVSPCEMLTYGSNRKKSSSFSAEPMESLNSYRKLRPEFFPSQLINADEKVDSVSGATKIVILRPGLDRMHMIEDSWNNTPNSSGGRDNIEEFLKEVKERLKSELQGKSSKKCTTVRGGGIETPFREKPSESKKIAQHFAQEVRDSVSRDLTTNLPRSESTRSCRSEIMLNGADSPEFINRDARKLLAERLKNVLKGETHQEVPRAIRNRSRLSMSDYEKIGLDQSRDTWISDPVCFPDTFTDELEKQIRSFRGESDEVGMSPRDLSSRNLIRSLSAPVSGTSFGKLLLEDRHVLTGGQIRRKHEIIEKVTVNTKKLKKEKFNIKEKVSSFRYSLSLRGRLFRKRVKSADGLDPNTDCPLKDMNTEPTAMMSFCDTNENSTEVPPSPASVCSSVYDEIWRPTDYLSPVSLSSANQLKDSEMSHVFKEINSNLTELRRKLNQFEGSVLEEQFNEQQPKDDEDVKDQSEAYIRDLLIAAGLYDGSFSRSMTKWDPLGKPISTNVFEEVEENHRQRANNDEIRRKGYKENANHKMILDLLNEVLPAVLREPVKMSKYMEKVIGTVHKPPHGKKLLSHVCNFTREYTHHLEDSSYFSLDNMLSRDLNSDPWSRVVDDDVYALGRGIECLIIGKMVEEMVEDLCL